MHVVALERQVPAHHGVQHHAQAPHIGLHSVVHPPVDHLRRGVAFRAALRLEEELAPMAVTDSSREPKVDQLDAVTVVEQEVLLAMSNGVRGGRLHSTERKECSAI